VAIREKQKDITLTMTAYESLKEIEMILKSNKRESIRVMLKFVIYHPVKSMRFLLSRMI
jgi:hypothetical protein